MKDIHMVNPHVASFPDLSLYEQTRQIMTKKCYVCFQII